MTTRNKWLAASCVTIFLAATAMSAYARVGFSARGSFGGSRGSGLSSPRRGDSIGGRANFDRRTNKTNDTRWRDGSRSGSRIGGNDRTWDRNRSGRSDGDTKRWRDSGSRWYYGGNYRRHHSGFFFGFGNPYFYGPYGFWTYGYPYRYYGLGVYDWPYGYERELDRRAKRPAWTPPAPIKLTDTATAQWLDPMALQVTWTGATTGFSRFEVSILDSDKRLLKHRYATTPYVVTLDIPANAAFLRLRTLDSDGLTLSESIATLPAR